MFEIYELLLPTRMYAIHKTQVSSTSDPTCRLCGTAPESMAHVLSACPALAQTKYLARQVKLFYCSNVWANCSKLNVDKLQSVQNFACRIVSGIRKYDHVTPELQRLRWLPVSSQLYYRNAILAFKCMYGRAPEYLSTFFTKRCDVNRYTTRSSQLLNVPLFKTASGQRTFYYRTVSIWNSLESFLKLSSNESIFKKRLRSKLLRDSLGCD